MAMPLGQNCGNANLRAPDAEHGQPVILICLDMLPIIKSEETISMVKIDVEGYEYKALQGLNKYIDKIQYIICEMSPE
jgi:FkbM family methyltransferase